MYVRRTYTLYGTNARNTFTYRDVPQVICLNIEYTPFVTANVTDRWSFGELMIYCTVRVCYNEHCPGQPDGRASHVEVRKVRAPQSTVLANRQAR